jgi:hypothetical protein
MTKEQRALLDECSDFEHLDHEMVAAIRAALSTIDLAGRKLAIAVDALKRIESTADGANHVGSVIVKRSCATTALHDIEAER